MPAPDNTSVDTYLLTVDLNDFENLDYSKSGTTVTLEMLPPLITGVEGPVAFTTNEGGRTPFIVLNDREQRNIDNSKLLPDDAADPTDPRFEKIVAGITYFNLISTSDLQANADGVTVKYKVTIEFLDLIDGEDLTASIIFEMPRTALSIGEMLDTVDPPVTELSIAIEDESIPIGTVTRLDFVGGGISATLDSTDSKKAEILSAGIAGTTGFYTTNNISYDASIYTFDARVTELIGEGEPGVGTYVLGIFPMSIPRDLTNTVSMIINGGSLTYPLLNRDGNTIVASQLTPNRLYEFLTLATLGGIIFRFVQPLEFRPQDYLVYAAWIMDDMTYTASDFVISSDTMTFDNPFLGDQPDTDHKVYAFAVPSVTGDINYLAVRPAGSNQIGGLIEGATEIMLPLISGGQNVPYKVWHGGRSSSGGLGTLPLTIGQEEPGE